MKRKPFCIALAALFCLSFAAMTACGETDKDENKGDTSGSTSGSQTPDTPSTPDTPTTEDTWHNEGLWLSKTPLAPTEALSLPTKDSTSWVKGEVAVHDPSIFQDPKNKMYYVFGTHYAVASSRNLIKWTQEVRDGEWEELYGSSSVTISGVRWPEAIKDTVELVSPTVGKDTINSTWAPDVETYNGKYYMYYSVTKAFGSSESAIARVEADSVMGPYSNNTILLDSVGETGTHPNCIDPELFYDKEGKLWMVYGSHFAGVYIKELYNEGEKWGLPKEEGWGKLLWKGGSQVVEGPFVFYNATNDYYYLMTTYGALMETYNMRVARSKNPDGPYVDAEGTDLATSSGNGTEHGVQIASNYFFEHSDPAVGYGALGHNSVIKDADGRYFVVYHTRRQEGVGADSVTDGHNLRVSQLYFNKEGWPVMAPSGYDGESAGTVTADKVAATYEVVLHTYGTQIAFKSSEDYVFTADGKVTKGGADAGTWTLESGFYIDIVLGQETYHGVVAPVWDMYGNLKGTVSLTATSDKGHTLWAMAKA